MSLSRKSQLITGCCLSENGFEISQRVQMIYNGSVCFIEGNTTICMLSLSLMSDCGFGNENKYK